MRVKYFFYQTVFLLVIFNSTYSQGDPNSSVFNAPLQFANRIGETFFNLEERLSNKPLNWSNRENINGTPFFLDSFTYCNIFLKNGKTYFTDKMRLNLFTQELHFLNKEGNEFTTTGETVKKAIFYKELAKDSFTIYSFSCGYPAIDNNSELTYYLELDTGKVLLLEQKTKTVITPPMVSLTPPPRRYSEQSTFYVYNPNHMKMERWRKGKGFILDFFSDKKNDIEKFIESKNINCKSLAEIKKVIEFYNTL